MIKRWDNERIYYKNCIILMDVCFKTTHEIYFQKWFVDSLRITYRGTTDQTRTLKYGTTIRRRAYFIIYESNVITKNTISNFAVVLDPRTWSGVEVQRQYDKAIWRRAYFFMNGSNVFTINPICNFDVLLDVFFITTQWWCN